MTLVLYHAECNDGLAAAWAVMNALRDEDAEFIPVKHNSPVPVDVTGHDVILLDFIYPRAEMLDILAKCRTLRIYDHHVPNFERVEGFDKEPKVKALVLDGERSGATIAWDEFHNGVEVNGLVKSAPKRPKILAYIEDNDLGRTFQGMSKHPEETRAIVEALRAQPRTFETLDLFRVACDNPTTFDLLLGLGKGIVKYKDELVVQATHFAQEVDIGGHKVFAANVPYFLSSETAHALIRDRPFGATYYWDAGRAMYAFSLRSGPGFDVSVIAKQYGGGGHPPASGFAVKKLPWTVQA